jgi:hypothetical protein
MLKSVSEKKGDVLETGETHGGIFHRKGGLIFQQRMIRKNRYKISLNIFFR